MAASSDSRPSPLAGVAPGAAVPSFEALYDEHAEFVFRSLLRLGVAPAQADDALQEVFVVVHRRLPSFVGGAFLRTWLFRIALRIAHEVRRRERRAPVAAADRIDELPEERTPGPWRASERTDRVRLLHRLLDALDDDKRSVFILAELEQMSVPAIAEALEINVNTAYARLRAARQRFERALAEHRATAAREVGDG